jgi:O-antigen ligase
MPSFRQLYHSGRLSQYLLWLACGAGVAGLLASRALVALSPVAGVLAALANPRLRPEWRSYLRNGAAMRAAALYLLYVLSGFYTSNWPTWRHEVFRLLPWIGVPLAFAVAVPLTAGQRRAIGAFFVLGTAAVGLATLGQYFLDPAAANEAIMFSQTMPAITGIFHIHFSVMLALAFFLGLLLRRSLPAGHRLRLPLLLAAVAAALTIHLLAYRTGLLVFYLVLLVEVLQLLWHRRVVLAGAFLLALLAGPWLAYHTLEPVRQRVSATIWDVEQFAYGNDINEASLSRRFAAWQTAAEIVKQHPLLGVGPADAYDEMMKQYDWHDFGLLPANRVMIHNQYLHYLVGSGLLGLLLWLLLLLGPLVKPRPRRNPYIWHFLLILGTAMLGDSLLELQTGFNLFVFGYGFLVVAAERGRATPSPALSE